MNMERLTECIGKSVRHARFRNVFKQSFESSVMRELYARKMKRGYSLSNTDAISVREAELAELVSELLSSLTSYRVPESGAVCNGLYNLMGSLASPRRPSVENYAKILVLAAARIGPQRVVNLFTGWLEGAPIRVWLCALLKGVSTDGSLEPVDGLRLETLPANGDDFPRSLYVQIDEHDIRHEQYSHRAMLSLEHNVGPALYLPNRARDEQLQLPPRPKIRNPELSSVSVPSLCRSMSIEINNYIDWFMQWWDYGEVDAFFLNAGFSSGHRETRGASPKRISVEQFSSCMELHGLLEKHNMLDLGIARWLRSKHPLAQDEQLVELRIALESVLLSDDRGSVGEKRHRLASRGAWLLGETFESRKEHFRTLRNAYDFASSVLHAGNPKAKNRKDLVEVIGDAQDLCRAVILRIVTDAAMPDWSDIVMGKGFRRVAEDSGLDQPVAGANDDPKTR